MKPMSPSLDLNSSVCRSVKYTKHVGYLQFRQLLDHTQDKKWSKQERTL